MLGVREVGVPIASITAFIGGFTSAAVFEVTNERGWEPVPLPLQIGLSPHGGVRVALRFEFGR